MHYILDEHDQPQPEPDTMKWAAWMRTHQRECVVQEDILPSGVRVTTEFKGMNLVLARGADRPPLLFETMICGGTADGGCTRYASLEEAARGHKKAMALVQAENN